MKTGFLNLKMPKNKGKNKYKKRNRYAIKFRKWRIRSKIWMNWNVSAYFKIKFLKLR